MTWREAIFRLIQSVYKVGDTFSVSDLYQYKTLLSSLKKNNNPNINAKIRQVLKQELVKTAVLEYVGCGVYRLVSQEVEFMTDTITKDDNVTMPTDSIPQAVSTEAMALSDGEWVENPFVRDLQAIYRNSRVGNAENRGLDSQFAEETYVPTDMDGTLLPDILAGNYWLVLLTGNPGDGKTAFLEKVGECLGEAGATSEVWDAANGWHYVLNGHHFIANFDASESSSGRRANEILDDILEHLPGPHSPQADLRRTVLIAINDGRLRDYFLFNKRYEWLGRQIYWLLEEPDKDVDNRIALVDLKARCLTVPTTEDNWDTSLFEQILNRLLADAFWEPCLSCRARTACPIKFNRDALANSEHGREVRRRLAWLFELTHLRGTRHTTIRDLRSALSYIIAGVRSCQEIHEEVKSGSLPEGWYNRLYFMAAFNPDGEPDDELEDMKTYDPALVPTPRLDRFFHYNREVDERMDLEKLCFSFQARPTHLLSKLTFPLMNGKWYGAMKRRFYFEASDEALENHELQLPNYHHLLPDRHANVFRGILAGQHPLEEVRSWLCESISRSDGIVDSSVYCGFLCVLTNDSETQELAVFKRFPVDEFKCEIVQLSDARLIEFFPNTLRLVHIDGDAILDIHLDLFEILMRYREGYLPGAEEQAPFVIDLEQFKTRLLRLRTQEILLLESGRKLHRIMQENGVIRRLPLEEV
ncbi:hypothetical protein HYR99_07210 [Candidatus Poribacteria bacterium]|nr:hypothetical protein [Candidatus Poribacteria bacterium]